MSANNPKGSDGMQLDDRKTIILQAIIRNYLETGEPVGSRTISKYTDLNLSSATIRNEMADLEEMGYIIQPHTSGKLLRQHEGGFLRTDSFQTGNKVNHIPVCLTAETVKAPVNLHAGVFISMEGADTHPVSSHPDSKMLRSLPGGNRPA